MIFGGAIAGFVVASMMFTSEHDDGAFSAFSQKDVRQEIPEAPCPVKEASKEEIRRLATIELPTLPRQNRKRPLNPVHCLRLASPMQNGRVKQDVSESAP